MSLYPAAKVTYHFQVVVYDGREFFDLKKPDFTRAIVSSAIDKAIRDIENDANRSIRNLIDLVLKYTKGRFQRSLFKTFQAMMQNENSAYYTLVKNIVAKVDHETIKTFGFNLGYNGCTNGAKLIRDNECSYGFNIPWAVSFVLDRRGRLGVDRICDMVEQGRSLGIFTYLIFCNNGSAAEIPPLLSAYHDCAFVLFTQPAYLDDAVLDEVSLHKNVMTAILSSNPEFALAASELHKRRMLYSAYLFYGDANAGALVSGTWLDGVVNASCAFAVLIPEPSCGAKAKEAVRQYVNDVRRRQESPVLLMDTESDILLIDQIISEDSCSIGFGSDGAAFDSFGTLKGTANNLWDFSLMQILRENMQKGV